MNKTIPIHKRDCLIWDKGRSAPFIGYWDEDDQVWIYPEYGMRYRDEEIKNWATFEAAQNAMSLLEACKEAYCEGDDGGLLATKLRLAITKAEGKL